MVKILITTIQVNFCAASQTLPELSLLKFLPLTYHHSHFLAATLDFISFFTIAFLRAAHFFLQLGCFGLDIYIYIYAHSDLNFLYGQTLPYHTKLQTKIHSKIKYWTV